MFYKVIDEITGEMLIYDSLYKAETEAERRLSLHVNGYETKRKTFPPVKAILIKPNERTFTICIDYDSINEED